MSTRSLICKEVADGQYYGVYCHSDGYLTYNGAMLIDHYSNAEKVDELLSFGDMSILRQKIHPDPLRPHGFDYSKQQENICLFYGRDCGKEDTQARTFTLADAAESDCDYMYVFGKDGVWRYCMLLFGNEPTEFENVREALDNEYKSMGIKRPKGRYGFWTQTGIKEEKMKQNAMNEYDENLTYNDNLMKKVQTELDEFKEEMLSKSPIEIYNEAGKIRFYEYMNDYIQTEEIDEDTSKTLFKSDRHVLGALWDKMLDLDGFNIGNVDDADFLIDAYVSDCSSQM